MKVICNWATAMYNNPETDMTIEIIEIRNGKKKSYRLFCSGANIENSSVKTYYHAFVKNESELDKYISDCSKLPETTDL